MASIGIGMKKRMVSAASMWRKYISVIEGSNQRGVAASMGQKEEKPINIESENNQRDSK